MEKEMTQAERVRQSQLTIARGMKVLPESLKVLEDVRDWTAREWLYICALDGVDIKQLVNNSKGKLTVTYIKKCRDDFFESKYAAPEKLQTDMEQMQREVKETCEKSRRVRKAVTEMIAQQKNLQSDNQQDMTTVIREKDDIIKHLQEQINVLKKDATQAAYHNKELNDKKSSVLKLFHGRVIGRKRKSETKKFVEQYLRDDKFDSEQIEFLLACMEEGMCLSDIEKLAIPGISVDVMKRLKALCIK